MKFGIFYVCFIEVNVSFEARVIGKIGKTSHNDCCWVY